ncbi:SAV_2336 N-terminal domain-related protein [Kitasatospora sp. NPDC002040]|uniref:SAV_2336 N-terminal domain-related protein n=1 Tax=Kitasatospora sp. NPDC002040 TaxID=3154661 RepID=UPI003331B044
MSSEPRREPGKERGREPRRDLDRFAALLTGLGRPEPDPVELAELLWLAARSGSTPGPAAGDPPGRRAAPGAPGADALPPEAGAGPGAALLPLHLPAADQVDGAPAAGTVATPSAPMLARPLDLQRALRPLKRHVPDPRRVLLDEGATAHRLAEALRGPGRVHWLPVLRPSSERWLSLRLVLDCGPTMALWRPLARELALLLRQTGAFRQVTSARLTADGVLSGAQPGPRTVTLLLSDAMGPQWRPGPAGDRWYRTLGGLLGRGPVAVVQPLPERLWPLTALPAGPGVLSSAEAGAANSRYGFAPLDHGPGAGPVLPVLEADPEWLANWAALVGSPGGTEVVGAAVRIGAGPPQGEQRTAPDPAGLGAEELVRRFRAVASREAYTLAGLAALTTPALPVLRLLQRAAFARPRPQHLAELVVSGLLAERPGHHDRFDFRPGVRELLVHTLPRSLTHQAVALLIRVGEQIAARAGLVPNELAAIAATDTEGAPVTAERRPFALVSPAALGIVGVREPAPAARARRPGPRAILLAIRPDPAEVAQLHRLVAALGDPDLVGMHPDHISLHLNDPDAFRQELYQAEHEVADLLLVYLTGVPASEVDQLVTGLPGNRKVLLLDLVGRSRRFLGEVAYSQVALVRPESARSLAAVCEEVLRSGTFGGPPELDLREFAAELVERADEGTRLEAEPVGAMVFTRNPAAGRRYVYLAREPGEDPAVDRFCDDLGEEIWQLTDLAVTMRQPSAVARCELFVPLYSREYFRSARCGREWAAFTRRTDLSRGFVPVLGHPVLHRELPYTARQLDYADRRYGDEYARHGLFGLPSEQYELAVHRIAARIVESAGRYRIAPGRPTGLAVLPNAFR